MCAATARVANRVVFILPQVNDMHKEEDDDADNEKALLLADKVVASLVARFGPATVVDWELLNGQADEAPCFQVDFAKRLHAELAVLQADTMFSSTLAPRAGSPNAGKPSCCRVDFGSLPLVDKKDTAPDQEAIIKRSKSFDDVLEYCWHGENGAEGILSLMSYGDDVNANDSPVKIALAQLGKWATKALTGDFELEAWMQEGVEIAGQQCDNVITASKTKLMDYATLVKKAITHRIPDSLQTLADSDGTGVEEGRLKTAEHGLTEVEHRVGAVVRGLRTTSSVLDAPVVLLTNVHKVLRSISGISAQAVMEGWITRIESLVNDGVSDALEELHTAIEHQLEKSHGQPAGDLGTLSSAMEAFNGRINVCQTVLNALHDKYPDLRATGEKVLDILEKLAKAAASARSKLSECKSGEGDDVSRELRAEVLALILCEMSPQTNDAQKVSGLAHGI